MSIPSVPEGQTPAWRYGWLVGAYSALADAVDDADAEACGYALHAKVFVNDLRRPKTTRAELERTRDKWLRKLPEKLRGDVGAFLSAGEAAQDPDLPPSLGSNDLLAATSGHSAARAAWRKRG